MCFNFIAMCMSGVALFVCVCVCIGEPDTVLNPKKKVWETVQPDLRTNSEGVACYKETPLSVEGKGVFRAPTLRGTPIK